MGIISKILKHNWGGIIYFNFKMLPFKQAIHLPFDFYHKVRFVSLKGRINLECDTLYRGMVSIGGRGSEMFPHTPTIIDIQGSWIFNGIAEIGCGALIHIEPEGELRFGNNVRIGARTKIYCNKEITIGEQVDISWESQVFDTNFHFMKNMDDNTVSSKDGIIRIGSHNWFGNRCNIMKGTITPNNTIVASNSLTNKNYTQTIGQYTLMAGTPAKVMKTNVKRLFEGEDI